MLATQSASIIPRQTLLPTRPSPDQAIAIRRNQNYQSEVVPHLGLEEVKTLADHAENNARKNKGLRDALLIKTLFDGCFRISEALSLTPKSLVQNESGWSARIIGKGRKYREAAVSSGLVIQLINYCYNHEIKKDERIFNISPTRAWQVVNRAFETSGIMKPDGVGSVHILRHSGAIERLSQHGNGHALQAQLGHSQPSMTLKYLRTITSKESLKINQSVEIGW